MTVALTLTSRSSSAAPEPNTAPSPSPSEDPLRGASLLVQLMSSRTSMMLRVCSQYTAPGDSACGQGIEKTATAAAGVRDHLAKIPANAEVTKLDGAMAEVVTSAEELRSLHCYGLSKPPKRDIDQKTRQQLCFVGYGILLATVTRATDPVAYR